MGYLKGGSVVGGSLSVTDHLFVGRDVNLVSSGSKIYSPYYDSGLYASAVGFVLFSPAAATTIQFAFKSGYEGTIRGYVYGDSSSNFGLLNNGGNWSVRVNSGGGNAGGQLYGTWTCNGGYGRTAYSSGSLIGGHNNIGDSSGQSNPIYVIGDNYLPTNTALSNMYGIGFTSNAFWTAGLTTGWGLYVATAGAFNAIIAAGGAWFGIPVGIGGGITGNDQLFVNSSYGSTSQSAVKVWYNGGTSVLGEVALIAQRTPGWCQVYVSGTGSSGVYAFYADGTLPSAFLGNVSIGINTASGYRLWVTGTVYATQAIISASWIQGTMLYAISTPSGPGAIGSVSGLLSYYVVQPLTVPGYITAMKSTTAVSNPIALTTLLSGVVTADKTLAATAFLGGRIYSFRGYMLVYAAVACSISLSFSIGTVTFSIPAVSVAIGYFMVDLNCMFRTVSYGTSGQIYAGYNCTVASNNTWSSTHSHLYSYGISSSFNGTLSQLIDIKFMFSVSNASNLVTLYDFLLRFEG
jgi:hypothetical protein